MKEIEFKGEYNTQGEARSVLSSLEDALCDVCGRTINNVVCKDLWCVCAWQNVIIGVRIIMRLLGNLYKMNNL